MWEVSLVEPLFGCGTQNLNFYVFIPRIRFFSYSIHQSQWHHHHHQQSHSSISLNYITDWNLWLVTINCGASLNRFFDIMFVYATAQPPSDCPNVPVRCCAGVKCDRLHGGGDKLNDWTDHGLVLWNRGKLKQYSTYSISIKYMKK